MKYRKKDMYKRRVAKRYELKRLLLKALIYSSGTSHKHRVDLQEIVDSLPRNSSFTRIHNFCTETGRARGVRRYFKLSRIKAKEYSLSGKLPGMRKVSW